MQQMTEDDPMRHVQQIRIRLQELIDHLHQDLNEIDEPQATALFERTAEALSGIKKAFSDYELQNENAGRKPE